jgi:hypothetical protein
MNGKSLASRPPHRAGLDRNLTRLVSNSLPAASAAEALRMLVPGWSGRLAEDPLVQPFVLRPAV